jgi:NhaP-type Na+/H+ or K+/H+ antiporter
MRSIAVILMALLVLQPSLSRADNPTREFIMSCTYGVLAGTLVGAASLAFTSQPGSNLDRVARGASLGLYTGILLGLYIVYIVPGLEENPDEEPVAQLDKIRFSFAPTYRDSYHPQPDGLRADWIALRF